MKPVALSAVMESTAIPFTKLTLAGLCVERLNGDPQFPTAQPLGIVEPLNSSRHCIWNAPLAYDEYCTQLMYWRTGRVEGLRTPPKLASPAQTLKWIAMPCDAFCVYSVTLAPVTLRICVPSMNQAM